MTRAGPGFRAGAALLLALPLWTAPVRAQDAGEVSISVQTSPRLPVAGSAWTLTLLVDGFLPREVSVFDPPFPESFFLDKVQKEPRFGETGEDSPESFGEYYIEDQRSRGTVIEYRFILNDSGTFTLDSFTVVTPRGQVRTEPLLVKVQSAEKNPGPLRFRLAWEGLPPGLRAGDTAVIGLRLNGTNHPARLPDPEMWAPPVPPGMILQPEAPGPEDRAAGLVLWLRLIPLQAAAFAFPAKTLSFEGAAFEVPALRIPVSPALTAPEAPAPEDGPDTPAGGRDAPLFPDSESPRRRHPVLFGIFRKDFENVYRTARNWWDRGYRAEALAELRRNERDHPAGSLFWSLRRDAERNLGLARTEDEPSRIARLAYLLACGVLALAGGLVYFRLPSGFRGKKAVAACAVLCAAAGLVFLYRFVEREMPGSPRSGVLKETALYRVPDPRGAVLARLGEGRPARLSFVPGKNGPWVRVSIRDEDGAAGWVPADRVVFY